jgi:hypothetical protein
MEVDMRRAIVRGVGAFVCVLSLLPSVVQASNSSFIDKLGKNDFVANTVPANGDQNPYGVAVVEHSTGKLVKGDILVSNFNNSDNKQGIGTTIVEISPGGAVNLFAHIMAADVAGRCPGGVGLTTALVVLQQGWVIVGSLPTTDGTTATAKAGCLIVLNSQGKVAGTIEGGVINGPWDMTAVERGNTVALFVTNVLNGNVATSSSVVNEGTVVRLDLRVDKAGLRELSRTVIGDGFAEKADPVALIIGPTGVGLGHDGTLYVADSLENRIAAISDALKRKTSAGTGTTVTANGAVNDPLGLVIAPNGNILETNGNDGNLVEISPHASLIVTKTIDTTGIGAGTLFGLAVSPNNQGVYYVNDGDNTFHLLHK